MIVASLLFLAALQATPTPDEPLDPAAAHLAAGREAWSRGDLGAALDQLREAAREAPGETTVILDLARVLNDLGRGDEAREVLAAAGEDVPRSAWWELEEGRAKRLAGDASGAVESLRRAIDLYPRCGPARLFLSELLLESAGPGEARAVLEPLAARAPLDPSVALLRSRIEAAEGNHEGAAAILRASLEAHPDARETREERCRMLLEAGRADEAWETGEPLLDGDRGPDTLRLLARVAEEAQRPVDAVALLGAALVDDPTHAAVLADLGEILEHSPDLRRRIARRRIDARPGNVESWRELLETYLGGGDLNGFFKALAEVPPALRTAPRVRLVEGEALRRAGRGDEAREVLESLCRGEAGGAGTTEDVSRAWYELGLLAHAEASYEEAARDFARAGGPGGAGGAAGKDGARRTSPWAADACFNRGLCLARLGRHAEAARAFEDAIARRPDFREAWLQLGACRRYRLGDGTGARKAYARWLVLGGDDPEIRRYVEEQP